MTPLTNDSLSQVSNKTLFCEKSAAVAPKRGIDFFTQSDEGSGQNSIN